MKFLVTSDLHLSDRIWRHRPIEGDSYHSWDQIVDLAIEDGVHAIILAGDLLDRQANLSMPVQKLVSGLIRLREANIEIWYIQGQHEFQQHPWMQMIPEPIWFQKNDLVTPEGWVISGCDYQNAEILQAFLKSERATNADILVLHQVWKDFMGDMGKPQGEFADIPNNIQVLITGDYHEHICQKYGELIVLSPGSTHKRSIAEPDEQSVFLMELGARTAKPKIKSWTLATRRCVRVNTKGLSDYAQLSVHTRHQLALAETYAEEMQLPEELRKPLLHLTYRPEEADLVVKFISEFSEQAHLFFKEVVPKPEDNPELLSYLDPTDRVSMLSCLDHFVDAEKQPLTYSLAVALLQSPDPEQALFRWVKEQV